MTKKNRLITCSDLDGVVCAVLLKDAGIVDNVKYVHPRDMQNGIIEVTNDDIIANLPYHPNARMVFDHHASELERNRTPINNYLNDPSAPSAARVIYEYYGSGIKFRNIPQELMDAADKIDSAQLTKEEILDPQGWVLLGFIMDPRTGFGRFHNFRISNHQLMLEFVDILRTTPNVEDILKHPDVAERVELYRKHISLAPQQIRKCAELHGNLLVIDLRDEKEIYTVNRFAIYALYPEINISMHVLRGKQDANTVFAVGKSVLNRTAKIDVGSLMLKYGGGGHKVVGSCQIDNDKAEAVKKELIQHIIKVG